MTRYTLAHGLTFGLSLFGLTGPGYAATNVPHIPDEYESASGLGSAVSNGGCASTDAFTAVRLNPALITSQKSYSVNATYNWPTEGRDYYQGGIVDAKTSPIAAGVSYTGFPDVYQYQTNTDGAPTGASPYDSPVTRRISLAAAETFGSISVGVGATYVEAKPVAGSAEQRRGDNRITGTGLNFGLASSLSPDWTVGASVENLSTPKIKDYAPRTFRLGTAYQFSPLFTAYLDARQRDRVPEFESQLDLDSPNQGPNLKNPERMVIVAGSVQIQDYLRVLAGYGESITDDRRSLSGGVALINKNFSLSYTAARPYMKLSAAHQAVMVSFEMAM